MTTQRDQLIQEIQEASDPVIAEVLDFLRFIKARQPASKRTSDHLTGLFADEPEAMQQIMDWIEQDRELDRQKSLE
ncbi:MULTISPECIES: hypothetical protein [Leptolyngbya]|uniref:DUF2281 domain-containing protein n=1 Tax=Leptolyngbya boryana CZ1 TaxID=3060204 RepID=A0AA96WU18_LEPBY|nr:MULTISPECIES: hypothetical protein [Leptolyngbya]MCY6491218.1 hypothetical protein [Leptolyngbya sp. GGD]WNZ46006.1 hypothetical protein Q2T42_29895 [Leptolyngbya boryana CZ1]